MDLSQFEMTSDAVFVQLVHFKSKKPLFDQMENPEKPGEMIDNPDMPVGVRIFSADSEEFKKHRRRVQNQALEARGKKNAPPVTAERIDEEAFKTMAACIAEIVNVSWKGRVLKAPEDSLMMIKVMPWAADQIDEAMADRSRFMPALPTSS